MKVLIGNFSSETNEHTYRKMDKENFLFFEGQEVIDRMQVGDIFADYHIDLVPILMARGHPGALITQRAFNYIVEKFLTGVKEHLLETDGIFLFLHGASKVEGLNEISLEHYLLREIRKITGPYMPIALSMDPHGNMTEELASYVNIVRCYRESPHTDIIATFRKVATLFCEYLTDRSHPTHPIVRKLPLMVGGERSVSTDEPVVTINRMLDEAEKDPRILSASFHVGYLRHDSYRLGSAIVVVPRDENDAYAKTVADTLADAVLKRRYQFHYHGNYGEVDESVEAALSDSAKPIVLTDSGDNCGAGSDGYGTILLRAFLSKKNLTKSILIAGIIDEINIEWLMKEDVGASVDFELGMDKDEISKKVPIKGKIVAKGVIFPDYLRYPERGPVISIKLDDFPITVSVEKESVSFTEMEQFEVSNLNPDDYDIIVVKEGYISPDYDEYSEKAIMVLTDGPTNQKTEDIVYHQIPRPMFPFDELDYPYEGKIKGGFGD